MSAHLENQMIKRTKIGYKRQLNLLCRVDTRELGSGQKLIDLASNGVAGLKQGSEDRGSRGQQLPHVGFPE